jgi:penicillin amidase
MLLFTFSLTLLFACKTKQSANLPSDVPSPVYELDHSVEVLVDKYGIPHIYAQTQHDLFFAQGYHAAKDRLFQFEVWRRQATGTVAEILGERELKRDIGTRLFKFRKDINKEMAHYHDDGIEIITAYVDGVNAYIEEVRKSPKELPLEFGLLGILPELWTPEVVISRHQGLLGNVGLELEVARAVAAVGEDKVRQLVWFHPKDPDLTIDSTIELEHLSYDILGLYDAYRKPVAFIPEDIVDSSLGNIDGHPKIQEDSLADIFDFDIGSNNWVVKGDRTESGMPIMANDPHRTLAVPSLRYMAHLVAPGWNVIGGGEPEIPGISIGHNEHGAWGLTVFRTDAEDIYVYKTNPDNSNQYWHNDNWVDFDIITERINVKGKSTPVEVELKYSIHGPVSFEKSDEHVAFAVKCGWLEYGGSPYLASLRMDQATNFDEFREACTYSNIPGENMVWADKSGNIGWQVVGINPYRRTHSGMVPVPGDGRYEWDGYIPMKQRPNEENPDSGYIITANQSVTPKDYTEWDAIGYNWSDPYRGARVKEVLESKTAHSVSEMAALQSDYLSLPARELVPLLTELNGSTEVMEAIQLLTNWNYVLSPESAAAGLYVSWEQSLKRKLWELIVPLEAKEHISTIQLKRVIDWLQDPTLIFEEDANETRNQILIDVLTEAIDQMEERFGKDRSNWKYGDEAFKHVTMKHPLRNAVNEETLQKLKVGPAPRGGNGYTVASTGNADNQPSGGTFRVIIQTGDWDKSVANNSPGQSGNPEHKHYDNLFDEWSKNIYFPLYYSREKVKTIVDYSYELKPNHPTNTN